MKSNCSRQSCVVSQGCQILLDTIYQNGGNITAVHKIFKKMPLNKVNGHKVHQVVVKDFKNFHPNAFKNLPKLGDLV
jgi:hypothetical protein